jgi:hypothetical protein
MRSHAFIAVGLFGVSTLCLGKDPAVQTVGGTRVPCEIDVPATWKIVGTNASVVAVRGDGMRIMLSSDPHEAGDTLVAAKIACDGARELMPGAVCSDPQPVRIAGRDWLEFTVTAMVGTQPTTFLNYTFAGRVGTFTIIGQVPTADLEAKRDVLMRYMKTFRFPKA